MTRLERLDNWRARFSDEMDRQRRMPFAWGTHDCFLGLVVGAVQAITGHDLGRGYRGRYKSERKCAAELAADGHASIGDFMASLLPEHGHPSRARTGDVGVVAFDNGLGEALCLVDATGLIVMTDEGHGIRPRAEMIRSFKVG